MRARIALGIVAVLTIVVAIVAVVVVDRDQHLDPVAEPSPVVVEVVVTPVDDLDHELGRVADRVRHLTLPGVDGLAVVRTAPATLQTSTGPHDTCVMEVDPTDARRLGGDPEATGFADVEAPVEGSLVLNATAAGELHARGSRQVTAIVGDRRQRFAIAEVVDAVGLARHCGALVPPGTIAAMDPAEDGRTTAVGLVWLSMTDDARDDEVAVEAVIAAIVDEVGGPSVEVRRYRPI